MGPFAQRGLALVPVTLMLASLAALALALSLRAGMHGSAVQRDAEAEQARYLAEAALDHARWAADAADCRNYPAVSAVAFGPGSYLASVVPSLGAPVVISASGRVGSAEARLSRDVTPRAAPQVARLQPADNGKDTWIDQINSSSSYGSDSFLRTQADDDAQRTLLRFNLGSIPPASRILRAELSVEVATVNGTAAINLHRITRTWSESDATWNRHSGGLLSSWARSGGDYDDAVLGSFTATVGRHAIDVTALVQDWHSGARANHGVLLKVANESIQASQVYYASDHSDAARRPALEITHACPCSADCGMPPVALCSADMLPDTEVASFSTAALTDPWGVAFMPEGATFGGATVPAGDGWLLVDRDAQRLELVDSAGAVLASVVTPGGNPRDVTRIESGAWYGHVALTDRTDDRVYLLNTAGRVAGSFATDSFASAPRAISYIGRTASGLYDGQLAITSRTPSWTGDEAHVHLVDQSGALLQTLDVSAHLDRPWGVAHLPGTDKLLVVDDSGSAFLFLLDGSLAGQYDAAARFGASTVQGAAIDLRSCEHVLSDRGASLLRAVTGP